MKSVLAVAAVGLSLIGAVGVASAQSYGGRDSGYGGGYGGRDSGYGGRESGYGDRDYGRRGRDDDDRGRGSRGRDSGYGGFDESAYVRCNPDVRQALRNGQLTSALAHYQKFGRREGRRLSC
ncbi:hypothetical protein ASF28_04875 [Methylobacterium sp. Leaf99]|jgi:hypothetical protein|uniref:hypothetical protein n=1 Tax=unclassified Methylobacterium TaxID=2615210 RepID=UPI0006FD0A42|nr:MULTISPECIES: hypothetical protein [unclassified Methylobacterium]KQP10463.1 hypothetical protein ASF28_04875 [Methylobacterium sp. Leaf99]TXM70218.1 hypothetical protein FV218_16420 [Methylobacterium sp. WL69]